MMQLPSGIAAPLHILPWWTGYLAGIMLLFLLALLFMKYIRPLMKKKEAPRSGAVSPEAGGKGTEINKIIDRIQKMNASAKTYRQGLFELSREMKSYFERKTGLEIEEMTSREIKEKFSSDEPGIFFLKLEAASYRERDPAESDLLEMCRNARSVSSSRIKPGGG